MNYSLQRYIPYKYNSIKYKFYLAIICFMTISISFFLYKKPNALKIIRVCILNTTTFTLQILTNPIKNNNFFFKNIKDFWKLKEKNLYMKSERDLLLDYKNKFQAIQIENLHLRYLLRFTPNLKTYQITTNIIKKNKDPFTQQIIILAGKNKSICNNQAVITTEGLVGKINHVGNQSATIMTIYNSKSAIPVRIERTRERAIIKGKGNYQLQLLYLNKEKAISLKLGDRLITSGDGAVFPPNIFIGKIKEIDKNGKIWIKSMINWNNLEYVRIIKTKLLYNSNYI